MRSLSWVRPRRQGTGAGHRQAGEFEQCRGVQFQMAVPPQPLAEIEDQLRAGGVQLLQENGRIGAERHNHRVVAEAGQGCGHLRGLLGRALFGDPVVGFAADRDRGGQVVADGDLHAASPARPSRLAAASTTARISAS